MHSRSSQQSIPNFMHGFGVRRISVIPVSVHITYIGESVYITYQYGCMHQYGYIY